MGRDKLTSTYGTVTINTLPIALYRYSRRSHSSLVDVNQRKAVNIVFSIATGFRTTLPKRNSTSFKTAKFEVNYSFKENINSI